MKYNKVLLKLSGEALMGKKSFGIDPVKVDEFAEEISAVAQAGIELSIVIGGGNIFRGLSAADSGIDRVSGDYMGMLATIMNGIALQNTIEQKGLYTRLISAIEINKICEPYIRRRALRHLEKRRILIFVAGTGNPYFTTDTAAALRAIEMEAEIIIKGTRVDGIYSADPEKDPTAIKFDEISFGEVIAKDLRVMDMTAFTLCSENNLPVAVINMNNKGSLERFISGEKIGTLVSR